MRTIERGNGGTNPTTFGRRRPPSTAAPAPKTAAPAAPARSTLPAAWPRVAVALTATAIGGTLFCYGVGRTDAKVFAMLALGMFLIAVHQVLRCFGMSLPLTSGNGRDSSGATGDGSWFGDSDGGGCGDGGGD